MLVVCHHHLRPVNHRSKEELEGMLTKRKSVALAYYLDAAFVVAFEETLEKRHGFSRTYNRAVGIFCKECLYIS